MSVTAKLYRKMLQLQCMPPDSTVCSMFSAHFPMLQPSNLGMVRDAGAKKKVKVDSDHPLPIPFDMESEEAALVDSMLVRLRYSALEYPSSLQLAVENCCFVQKMGQQHGHKPVLEEDAVLNDAPLRSRMLHVARAHGVPLVHAGAVKTCSVAVEVYLREILQQMMRVHSIRTKQAKDVPGMVRDKSRNWARDVRPPPSRVLPRTPRSPAQLYCSSGCQAFYCNVAVN